MKETDKNAIKVFSRLKIVKENLSMAGVDGFICTACESSRYEGGTVTWNACSDPTPGSICKLTGTVALLALHPYYNANSIQLLPPKATIFLALYLCVVRHYYSISLFCGLNSTAIIVLRSYQMLINKSKRPIN